MADGDPVFFSAHRIHAGKWRRYHGEGWRQLLDIKTQLLNARDVLWLAVGFLESFWLLSRQRPAAMLVKGGFVGVPAATAGRLLGVPYMTHDSDAVAGLANRLVAGGAKLHATAFPVGNYSYPTHRVVQTGVPISDAFRPLGADQVAQAKQKLGLHTDQPVLLIAGGGLGAARLNELISKAAVKLINEIPRLHVYHLAGDAHQAGLAAAYRRLLPAQTIGNVTVYGFYDRPYLLSAAADVVVTRAGATALAEFAAQAKACLVVPNRQLTGGHQHKNAQALAEQGAVVLADESQSAEALAGQLKELLNDPGRRLRLARKLSASVNGGAAERVATLLLQLADGKNKGVQRQS